MENRIDKIKKFLGREVIYMKMKKPDKYSVVFYLGILIIIPLVLTLLNVLPSGDYIDILSGIYCVGAIVFIYIMERKNPKEK